MKTKITKFYDDTSDYELLEETRQYMFDKFYEKGGKLMPIFLLLIRNWCAQHLAKLLSFFGNLTNFRHCIYQVPPL